MVRGNAYSTSSDFPTATDLVNALATIIIEENGSLSPYIGYQYHPDAEVPVLTNGISIKKEAVSAGIVRITLSNITLVLPSCAGVGITGDIWASQADHGQSVHCVSSGISMVVGNPRVSGLLFCQLPRHYSVQVKNVGEAPITVSYNIYIDEGDGYYEPTSHDLLITNNPAGPYILQPGGLFQSGIQSYMPYSSQKEYADLGLWIEVIETGASHKTIYYISNSCIPLPVNLVAFTAQRKESTVALSWETAGESECAGFEVQRRNGGSDFLTVGFVPTKAIGGNSQSLLKYSYFDDNPVRSISEYRLKQRDLDGKSAISETRFVRGMSQDNEIVIYPNPTINGQVNVIFNELGRKDISLLDNNGRLIQQWRAFDRSNLQIHSLRPATYLLRVISETGIAVTQKFVVLN
jgi:hypothetical protein